MTDHWVVEWRAAIDVTVHPMEMTGHRIHVQHFGDPRPPRRMQVMAFDEAGQCVESWQGNGWDAHRRLVRGVPDAS